MMGAAYAPEGFWPMIGRVAYMIDFPRGLDAGPFLAW